MTDLRITDPVDQAMVQDMGGPLGDTPPLPEPTPTLDDATIALLKRYGFNHVPTVEELREVKARRQAEVRDEVLFQADRKNWCDEGTRQVCANLRLPRPGSKEQHKVTYRVTMVMEIGLHTYTDRGALAYLVNGKMFPVEGKSFRGHGTATNVVVENVAVDGTPFELTDDLRKELSNDQ